MARSLSTPLAEAVKSFDRSRWDLRLSTKQGYFKTFKRFGRFIGDATIGDLSLDAVNDFLAQEADHKTMSRNDCVALGQLAKWATRQGIFSRDPLNGIELPRGRGGKRKPFADQDVRTIISAAGNSFLGPRDQAIVVLALACALRPRELWLLQLDDIDFHDGILRVRLETTKTEAGERFIPIDPQALAALDTYVHDYRPDKLGALFLNQRGDPFKHYGFMAVFARLTKRLEVKGIDFSAYRMRHTGITNWARAEVSGPILQKLAGHRSIVTTQRYIGGLTREDVARIPSGFTRAYGRAV